MRRALFLGVMLWPVTAVGQDANLKPNTLTPKEIADGWLLLFDGESTFGWDVVDGAVKALGGKLEIKGDA
jgi:hypothetical protein